MGAQWPRTVLSGTADPRTLRDDGGRFVVGAAFQARTPHVLFEGEPITTTPLRSYDVTPDGQHFIMVHNEKRPEEHVTKLNVVLHWSEELKRRVPANQR